MISRIPGKTNFVSHTVTVGPAQPVRLAPYRVPQVHQKWIMEELVKMMEDGVIEELRSRWRAPVVLIQKKRMGC